MPWNWPRLVSGTTLGLSKPLHRVGLVEELLQTVKSVQEMAK